MSEINVTDQRPKTTTLGQVPEALQAKKKLEKDPALVAFIETIRKRFDRRVAERRGGEGQ